LSKPRLALICSISSNVALESINKSTGFPIAKIPAKITIDVKNITIID
jgi:hypothetical protein